MPISKSLLKIVLEFLKNVVFLGCLTGVEREDAFDSAGLEIYNFHVRR